MHKVLICLFLFSNTLFANSSWSPGLRNHAKSFQNAFEDGFASSLRGACFNLSRAYSKMVVPIEDWEGNTTANESGKLPMKVGLQRGKDGKPRRAPLAFYIPGAFNNLSSRQPKRWMDELTQRGYHTVVFPNPWGTQFIKEKSHEAVGHVLNEGKAIYDSMRDVFSRLDENDLILGPVRLLGVSYGGFLTAMISAWDAENPEPILSMDSTIMSPPFQLGETLDRLDQYLDATADPFNGMNIASKLLKFRNFCKKESQSELEEGQLHEAMGLVSYVGFHDMMVNSVKVFDKVKGYDKIPDRHLGSLSPKFRKWKKEFNFNGYIDTYDSSIRDLLKSEKGTLKYWVQRASDAGYNRVRVLVAVDDFLNDGSKWDGPKEKLITLPDGGHYGYRHLDWYESFINLAFGDEREIRHLMLYGPNALDMVPRQILIPQRLEPIKEARPDILDYKFGLELF